ncbi:glycoside hydrolase family 9 protein [Hahella sp. CR1]|uniref:glycoside hydrolase family 9 protein n=1 Tax=Hahella sp. CR1 TaxID=2992807 RepID=UPI0024415EA3|nr:glycoside hydrolase family 9 protein [Hahella sp. CR1]MDG9666633.1 glycoside hydrolase family 9 protein [Hahella sp. CR1]
MSTSLLVNHLGYSCDAVKRCIVQSRERLTGSMAQLICEDGEIVARFALGDPMRVAGWHTGDCYVLDFSQVTEAGRYRFEMDGCEADGGRVRSHWFDIDPRIGQRLTPLMTEYFRLVRCQGRYDDYDRNLPFFGQRKSGRVDVSGGWYDASGDVSKYLSHLSYANYMSPQQTPLVVWSLLSAAPRLPKAVQALAGEEALYGADFLCRMFDEDEGYFYQIVFDRWSKDPEQRNICNYATQKGYKSERWEASLRQGGGIAIAALAAAAQYSVALGVYDKPYRRIAERAFAHLQENNLAYLDNGKENIIDDYCALLAAVELYQLTGQERYSQYATARVRNLVNKQSCGHGYEGWWRVEEDNDRPFFHASDEGLPIIALLRAQEVMDSDIPLQFFVRRGLEFYLSISRDVDNPFGYPRQLVKPLKQRPRAQFFFPHSNESGYWWQGENARLGSLAAASRWYRRQNDVPERLRAELRGFEQNLQNWLLGLNPFNCCMVEGVGHDNPQYSELYPASKGGVCNGITSSLHDEMDVAMMETEDPLHSWRWSEQWLPHAAWWLLAFSMEDQGVS